MTESREIMLKTSWTEVDTSPLLSTQQLTAADRHRVLVQWNSTTQEYPHAQILHALLEAQVKRTPDSTAVVFDQHQLSYIDLNQQANQLARRLLRMGVGPDKLVGICVERSIEMVVGLLAILKAGGAYVPLDPAYPAERLSFMLSDSRVSVLLTQERLAKRLPQHDAQILCLDRLNEIVAAEDSSNLERNVYPENLAYAIYTSGSTGRPKGAMNTHHAICNRLLWMQQEYQLTDNDRVLQKTPFSFDVSVWEFFWPLITGAKLIVCRPGGHQDSAYLAQLIKDERITTLHFVPSMLQLFLEEKGIESCSSLRRVICSGEALPLELQRKFFSRLKAELHNLYGPTEAAVDVTYWKCDRSTELKTVPIGRPIANTQILVLDSALEPVQIGSPGELYIGGINLGRGYLGRPDLTAERFVPHPFATTPGERLYRTGDLARFLPDGNVDFLGRIDTQVKLRGFRIELGEIEEVLSQHPAVKAVVVLSREDDPGEKRLVAYILCASGIEPTVSTLSAFLGAKIPDYMVPSAFVFLKEFPLNPNGKLDRSALPAPKNERPNLAQAFVAPRNDLEGYLAGLWCEILKVDRVGVHDRFFELGGDSLKGAIFINKVKEDLNEFIYIVPLFEKPTIDEFSSFLATNYWEAISRKFPDYKVAPRVTGQRIQNVSISKSMRIDSEAVSHMRKLLPHLAPQDTLDGKPKNPTAIFILAPPRSGTTLLRVMLAGNPDLFAAAELQLLGFQTLQERRAVYTGKYKLWLEGTVRSIMEIKHCDAEEAKRIMEQYEVKGFTTKQFYNLLQNWIHPRILVDKSPSYALDLEALKKAEIDFENALYIHLIRHPYAMIRSFENYHFDQVLYTRDHPYSPRQLGELVWTVSHQNILEFLDQIPVNRKYSLKFEDLTARPELVSRDMCDQLHLRFHPEMIEPYKNQESKMLTGIYSASTPMGDTKFHEHGKINSQVAETWKNVLDENFLGDVTRKVAEQLGYEIPEEERAAGIRSTRKESLVRQKNLRREHRHRGFGQESKNG